METAEIEKPSPFAHALKSGLYVGIINALLTIILYVVDPTILANFGVGFGIILLNFVLVIVFGIQYRKEVGGYLSFGQAFLHGFLTFAVAGLIGILFNVLLYTVIDPDLPEVIAAAAMENTAEMLEGMGMAAGDIDAAMAEAEASTLDQYSVAGMLMSYVWALIIYAIVALITGLIVKKNEPVENY